MNTKLLKESMIIHSCMAISFYVSGLIVNLFQALFYISIRIFNKRLYRKINYYFSYSFYSQLVFLVEWWSGSIISLYIDPDEFYKNFGKEHALFISNHRYEIDWLIGCTILHQANALGNCKPCPKKSIQYVPVAGWTWKFAECIFLERNYDKDKETILKQIKEFSDYPDPICLSLFPEGTRFSIKKHEISQKFAIKNGLPLYKYHLTPRIKGFITVLKGMRGKMNAIYDGIITFESKDQVAPTIQNLLFGRKVYAHVYIERIMIDEIPKSDEEVAEWLYGRYVLKDKMYESFIKTGDFFSESGVKRVLSFKLPRRITSLVVTIFWITVVLIPIFQWTFDLLVEGNLMYFMIILSIFFSFYLMLKSLIGVTEVKKASTYGIGNKNL